VPRFEVVPEESRLWVRAHSSIHTIESTSKGIEGFIDAQMRDDGRFDTSGETTARIEIPIHSLTTGNLIYDREMYRSVGARLHPLVTGELAFLKETSDAGRYEITGELTFRGLTRTYTDHMTLETSATGRVRLEGECRIDLTDFSFEPPRFMMLRVHPEIDVRMVLVADNAG
jgi:polyisoprenoid-binding protein YceI